MKTLITTAVSATLITFTQAGEAQAIINNCNCNTTGLSRPADHAPIGVMGDHAHKKGEFMASYRYMNMHMEQIFAGSNSVPSSMAATGYMMNPTEMDMNMQMLGLMYAPTDRLTLMLMSNYVQNSMKMVNPMGVVTKMESSGLGDTSLSALYQVYSTEDKNAHIGFGVSLPTGDTDKLLANGRDQPFPMQLGSGTYDLLPSFTYNHYINNDWAWGAQAKAVIRLGENDQGYTLGDRYSATAWVSRNLNSRVALNARIEGTYWKSVDGNQTNGLFAMNPIMSLPADPSNTGGEKIDAFVGLNYISPCGARFALEAGKTLYQDLDGTQLGSDWTVQAGLQFIW